MTPPLRLLLTLVALAPPALAQGPGPSPVRVDAVRAEELQELRLVTGDVRAARRARIASEEEGRVLELLVDEGERVEEGAVLARLDATRLSDLAVLAAQETAAAAAEAERRREVEQEQRDLDTVRRLVESNAANAKELADAETALATAEARLAQASAELKVLGARADLLRQRLADMEVRAPFAGVVAMVDTEVGQWVGVGGTVVELVSDAVEVWLEVPQRHLAALRADQGPITVRVAGSAELASTDWRVVPVVDPSVRALTVIASLEGASGIAPGMSAEAWIPTSERAERLTVHTDALLRGEVGHYLFLAVPGPQEGAYQAMPRTVEVLWRRGTRAVVRADGLEPGALAIVEGNVRLQPMQAVYVVQDPEEDAGTDGRGADAGEGGGDEPDPNGPGAGGDGR